MIPLFHDRTYLKQSHTRGRELTLLAASGVFVAASLTALVAGSVFRDYSYENQIWEGLLLLLLWGVAALAGHVGLQRLSPGHDVILFPSVMTLCGWGLFTIWRLEGSYAIRQAVWICVGTVIMLVAVRLFEWIFELRNYPYVALLLGAFLTALTLLVGANPSGSGPRLWLSLGYPGWIGYGVYVQPSEILKPLLVIFFASYFARYRTVWETGSYRFGRELPLGLLLPILIMWGLSMFMVIIQRDLGAGWVLYWSFLVFLVSAARNWKYAAVGMGLFIVGAIFAYFTSDLVHFRVTGWLDPWSDDAGAYYQITQSVMAIRDGGLIGNGLGRGIAHLIPLAHSDLIFSAIVNGWGMLGAVAVLVLLSLIFQRIYMIALRQQKGTYLALLSTGLLSCMVVQSLINIGGALRYLPLTGVALPYTSYGGTSMVVWFFVIGVVYGSERYINPRCIAYTQLK